MKSAYLDFTRKENKPRVFSSDNEEEIVPNKKKTEKIRLKKKQFEEVLGFADTKYVGFQSCRVRYCKTKALTNGQIWFSDQGFRYLLN